MEPKVVVSFTTIPERLHDGYEDGIRAGIGSLFTQDYPNYTVRLNLPINYKLKNIETVIPDWLLDMEANNDNFEVVMVEDESTLTKIMPTLRDYIDPDTIIIICDDDVVYHHKMISEHVKNQTETNGTIAIGYDGLDSKVPVYNNVRDHFVVAVHIPIQVNTLQHYKTVSYMRRFFADDVYEFVSHTNSDDIAIGAYLSKQGIQKFVYPFRDDPRWDTEAEWQEGLCHSTFPAIRHCAHEKNGCNDDLHNGVKFFIPQYYIINGWS